MDLETFRELSFAYASGVLEGREADTFLKSLAAADEERLLIYAEASALAQDLTAAARPPELSAALQGRLRERVRAPSPSQAPKTPPVRKPLPRDRGDGLFDRLRDGLRGFGGFGIGFAVLALGAGILFYSFRLQGDLGRKETALEATKARVTLLEDSLSRHEAMLEVLLSHNLQVAVLKGQEKDPAGYGKMIWCPKRRCGILHVANLPPVPQGREYQLWFLEAEGGKPIHAGLFRVNKTTWDGDLYRIQGMKEVERARLRGFLVTLEPEGGSPAPTGDAYLEGSTLL